MKDGKTAMESKLNITTYATAGIVSLSLAVFLVRDCRAEPRVIELTQVACQFVESENGVDRGFVSSSKADCEAINADTAGERMADAEDLEVEPGEYIFRVTNVNVPYLVGFWLRHYDYDWGDVPCSVEKGEAGMVGLRG